MRAPCRRATLSLVALAAVTSVAAGGAAVPPRATIDTLVATCPTAAERRTLRRELSVSFEHDPTTGSRVCGVSPLQERAYQSLRVLKAIRFTRPLPWTRASLYDWFRGAARGVRFRGDIDTSFCCEPAGVVNVQAQYLEALDRGDTPSLLMLVSELVHEARHAQGRSHTCRGLDDQTLDERGAWYVESMLELWIGLYASPFLERYRPRALTAAQLAFERVCELPVADVSVAATRSRVVVRNGGGVPLRAVWLVADVPREAVLRSGGCRRVSAARTVCELGTVTALGARAFSVVPAPGVARFTVVAAATDSRPANNRASVRLR